MSYAIAFSSAARQAFERLDVEAQEAVLDEIDAFARSADLLPNRPLPLILDHETRVETSAARHDIFLRLEYEPRRKLMSVVRFGYRSQPKRP